MAQVVTHRGTSVREREARRDTFKIKRFEVERQTLLALQEAVDQMYQLIVWLDLPGRPPPDPPEFAELQGQILKLANRALAEKAAESAFLFLSLTTDMYAVKQVKTCYALGKDKPFDENLLKEIDAPLESMLFEEANYWRPPEKGLVRAQQSLALLSEFADWVQLGVWQLFQPYIAARRDGPFVDQLRYSNILYDKTKIQPTTEQIRGYVANRMMLVGGGGESILAAAGYDGARTADREALERVADKWLAATLVPPKPNETQEAVRTRAQQRQRLISFLVRYTGSHGAGQIGVVTEFPFHFSQAKIRWRAIRTLIHELGHALIHPDMTNAATTIAASQVITEGFVEVTTRELFNKIVQTMTPEIKEAFLTGVDKWEDPEPCKVGYGKSGAAAARVYDLVGRDRFFMAFFVGDVHHVGL